MISSLGAHVRVISQLFNDASRLQSLFKSYRVDRVPKPVAATVPDVDDHMTLKGILNRLLPDGDERYETYLTYLSRMEPQVNIERRLRDRFDPEEPATLRPCVHAEIQMLHHFHDDQRTFVAGDRYVACSKFACICFIQDLKKMVLDQISQRHISSLNHPDSVSQFSTAAGDEHDAVDSGTDVFEDESSGTDTAGFNEDVLAAHAAEVPVQEQSPGENSDTGSGVQI
ncbi:hypothetical protein K4K61_010305 [Colletotrichum sp. SAR11_59]|nr:hypothetical protein K4K61_010305 [Colletotrichum sp. SAR11_59]